MKNLEKIILIAVIVIPIVICTIVLRDIWSEDEEEEVTNTNGDLNITISDPIYVSGDDIISGDIIISNESGDIREMGGESFETKIGDPISKIYSDAEISSALSNVYLEADVNSEVVGKLEKHAKVTAQKFPGGWSRVTGEDSTGVKVSGWLKTENVSFPVDNGGTSTLGSGVGSKGKITAEPYLNVRLNPSTNATILTKVNKGETVTIEESSNGWYKITVNNVTGWVSADYVEIN